MTTNPITPPVPSLPPVDVRPMPKAKIRELMRQASWAAKEVRKFVEKNDSQRCQIEGGTYVCIESWQLLGALFGLTPMITGTQELEDGYLAIAHLRSSDGAIVAGAEAECRKSEPWWADKPSFQIRSMAGTRATGKAFRIMLGWVMVMAGFAPTPAEEMQSHPNFTYSAMTGKKCHECGNQISDKLAAETQKKFGKWLCLDHKKQAIAEKESAIVNPINDPRFVEESVKRVHQRKVEEKKASQGQPIVGLLDRSKDAYSL